MAPKEYISDFKDHLDLSFISAAFHNELVVLSEGKIKGEHFNDRRAFILSFTAMVEGIAYHLRQHLLDQHEKGTLRLSPSEEFILSERDYRPDDSGLIKDTERIYNTRPLFKFTVKTYAKHFGRIERANEFIGKDGYACCSRTFDKRNRIVHPKTFPDIHITDADWETAQSAFAWFHALQLALMNGNILTEREK